VSVLSRFPPRVQPPNPITVAIEDDHASVVAYGVMSDISRRGACVQTDVLLAEGARFDMRLSFAYPPEVHRVIGRVAWARADEEGSTKTAYRCGVEWLSLGYTLQCRIRQLTPPVAPGSEHRFGFDGRWATSVLRAYPGVTILRSGPAAAGPRQRRSGGTQPG
jgi:hypothetical protein